VKHCTCNIDIIGFLDGTSFKQRKQHKHQITKLNTGRLHMSFQQ